jgi:ABC-type glutathione transport system ATPase component
LSGQLIVVLGAPGTGKSTTVRELARILQARGIDAAAGAALERTADMLAQHRIVLLDIDIDIDTTKSVVSGLCRRADARILMSMDLGWLGRACPASVQAREYADGRIRAMLQDVGLSYAVVAGHGGARIEHALSLIDHLLDEGARQGRVQQGASMSRWRWFCDDCGDGDCEQHWLPRGRS